MRVPYYTQREISVNKKAPAIAEAALPIHPGLVASINVLHTVTLVSEERSVQSGSCSPAVILTSVSVSGRICSRDANERLEASPAGKRQFRPLRRRNTTQR
jgi:hypothetical protein